MAIYVGEEGVVREVPMVTVGRYTENINYGTLGEESVARQFFSIIPNIAEFVVKVEGYEVTTYDATNEKWTWTTYYNTSELPSGVSANISSDTIRVDVNGTNISLRIIHRFYARTTDGTQIYFPELFHDTCDTTFNLNVYGYIRSYSGYSIYQSSCCGNDVLNGSYGSVGSNTVNINTASNHYGYMSLSTQENSSCNGYIYHQFKSFTLNGVTLPIVIDTSEVS